MGTTEDKYSMNIPLRIADENSQFIADADGNLIATAKRPELAQALVRAGNAYPALVAATDRLYHAVHALMCEIGNRANHDDYSAGMFHSLIPENLWTPTREAAKAYYELRQGQRLAGAPVRDGGGDD